MKKINYIKFLIDIIMALIFTLLFNKNVLGMSFHEIAGLAIGAVFLVHCGLNWRWIKGITLKFFTKSMTIKTRILYVLDIILLINIAVIIISGVFISKVVFVNLGLIHIQSFKTIHIFAAYLSLMIIGIHLGLHWKWVIMIFKKIFKIQQKNIISYLSKVMMISVLVFGIYCFNSVGYMSKIKINSTPKTENRSEGKIKEKEMKDFNDQDEDKSLDNTQEGESIHTNGNKDIGNVFKDLDKNKGKDKSILSAISSNLGIISVFSIITYYLDKLINRRKSC